MSQPLDRDERDVVARSTGPAVDLARLLRELRAGRPSRVRQRQLADALGLSSIGGISSWENVSNPVTPTEQMLERIATFYASPRSVVGDTARILGLDELNEDERAERAKLLERFLDLRREAQRGGPAKVQRGPWHFAEGAVRIFCGNLGEDNPDDRSRFASGKERNYVALRAYADLDALVELFGCIRAENPRADIQFDLARRLESADLQAHLVFLGGMACRQGGTELMLSQDIPISQVRDPTKKLAGIGEPFEVTREDGTVRVFGPTMAGGIVVEDVGFFLRTKAPNTARTLTVCSGVFTRGTYGAVRLLTDETDPELYASNVAHISEKLAGASTYGVLMRIPTHEHATATPDLRDPHNILSEFSLPS